MADYFEVDFLNVGSKKSGDAITIRYESNGTTRIHVTDGGFLDTGDDVVAHIQKFYDSPDAIDSVIATHPDGDHAGGLRKILEEFDVNELWMLRPWLYADELLPHFSRFTSADNLRRRLKEIYPNIAALEEIAEEQDIPIYEPFQGARIGDFTVLAPSKASYLDFVVESEKTPEATKVAAASAALATGQFFEKAAKAVVRLVRALWGAETFPADDTSPENNMSVVQYANLFGVKILLTADAGRATLGEAADYAPIAGLSLPGIDRIQIPHHGSRHNVSTELLDRLLGERLASPPAEGEETFTAIASAAKEDEDHPRKSVRRAFNHRGGKVFTTEGNCVRTGHNAPSREGWSAAQPLPYPEDQEE